MKYVSWREPSEEDLKTAAEYVSFRLRSERNILLSFALIVILSLALSIFVRSVFYIVVFVLFIVILGIYGAYLLKVRERLKTGGFLVMTVKVTDTYTRSHRGYCSCYVYTDYREAGRVITSSEVFDLLSEGKNALLIKYTDNKIKRYDIVPV